MESIESQRLDQITAVIHQLLSGKQTSLLPVENLPDDEITQLSSFVNRLAAQLDEVSKNALNLASGKIDDSIDGKLPVASSLKNIQATLKHLTWQTAQVAKGDFSQRVDFLGDFSLAFNSMVEQLAENRERLTEQNAELQRYEHELVALVEERTAELKAANADLKQEMIEREDIHNKVMVQDKLATLGQVATGIAHELNQPLTYITTVIQTTIEKLKNNTIDPGKLINKFEKAAHQAARILDITTHLRTVGRTDDAKRESVNLANVIDDSLVLMNEKMKLRNISFKADILEPMPAVLGVHNKLEQVFINLTTNAIDALEQVGGGAINVVMSEKDDQIVIRYSDNGSGMPPEVRAKIFEPFYTTKERGKETGLGMAIINDIIVDHNGKIICESEQGKGTTFTITLPILKN